MPRDAYDRRDEHCSCPDSDSIRSGNRMTMESLECSHRAQRRCRSSRHECTSSANAVLREENAWLVQQLAISEASAQRWQERVHTLRHRVRAVEQQHERERAQWQQTMEAKERKWTDEYDRHMQSLLQIIAHHEDTHRAMREELAVAVKKAVDTTARSTQTNANAAVETGQQTEWDGEDRCCGSHHEEHGTAKGNLEQTHLPLEQSYEELVAPVESIHEQYVALTMQKLLEQLRQSNLQPSSRTASSVWPTATPPVVEEEGTLTNEPRPDSFRDSIRKRLFDGVGHASQYQPHTPERQASVIGRSALGIDKLPTLYEQPVHSDRMSSLRLSSVHTHRSPSAA